VQLTGLYHGGRLASLVNFPATEVLGPGAIDDEVQDLIARHGPIFIKPSFRGSVVKKTTADVDLNGPRLIAKVRLGLD
jgi:hypothetical protein